MTVDELHAEIAGLRDDMVSIDMNLRKDMDKLRSEINTKLNHHAQELGRLENTIDLAFLDAVHELIDYLRHEDIQSLDEEEFAQKLKELIGQTYLPF